MNDTSLAQQEQIFGAPLDAAERETVEAMVNRSKANAALTQQLALDASRLVASSQQRLDKQASAGFFKRLASSFSGTTAQNQLLNQTDMLQMQRYAWHYLQQLQQQNLINAQGIAVIRNNLGTMNEYVIETREFLEQAVDRIGHRLRNVENHAKFSNWALNIEANKRRFKSIPKLLLVLKLTYDFMSNHRDAVLTEREVANHLVLTLEKLDVNCDEEIRLLDFISELLDQIEVIGIDQYRCIIDISSDRQSVDSVFIQKNIAGVALNALYFLSDQYQRVASLIDDDDLCSSDEAREKIISKFFGAEFTNLSTTYRLRDLICEIVGGCQIALDIDRAQQGLPSAHEELLEAPPQEAVKLVSTLPDVTTHTYFDGAASQQSKRDYVLLFALCMDGSAAFKALGAEFIALCGEKLGLAHLRDEVLRLADHPRKLAEYLPVMQALLADDDLKYTWLLDAFHLLTLAGQPIETPQMRGILGALKPAQFKESLPQAMTLIGDEGPAEVLAAASKLAAHTQGWKNIIRYRELNFRPCFAETMRALTMASVQLMKLQMELTTVSYKGMEHAHYFSMADSMLSRITDSAAALFCSQGRRSALSDLNDLRKKSQEFISEHGGAITQANWTFSRWKMPNIEYKNSLGHSDYELDNSADNEDWSSQFERYYRAVEDVLNSFSSACSDAGRQLELYAAGDFDRSVMDIKAEQRREQLRREQQKRLEKQSVTIVKDGKPHLFTIEWQQVDHPPCALDDIQAIKTNGKVWLALANVGSDELLYRSEDGVQWRQVSLDRPEFKTWIERIEVVDGVWIIRNRALAKGTRPAGVYYSDDALTWRHVFIPEVDQTSGKSLLDGHMVYGNIFYFRGMWLWMVEQYQRYTYIEKGFFSDTTKTGTYAKTIIFRALSLDSAWQPWEHAPKFPEGVKIKNISPLPNGTALLAFCEYDSSYLRDKKKPEEPPFTMYFGARDEWQSCRWGGDIRYLIRNPVFVKSYQGFTCYLDGEVLASASGYDWALQDANLHMDDCFVLDGVQLFASQNNKSTLYVTQDGRQFDALTLEDGYWSHIVANDQGALGVYQINSYEKSVLRVGRYVYLEKR
ncbi:hypothetical protein P3W70_27955 [Achromobacter denitrificans]|uniref:hypothetical protein n=1 Tax=Achromobacter denitrificans TaxID=32002 RepID=UPI0023E7C6E3|nr:hypothetical protein [Achromobacter denitrificans]MDF3862219.1 hypothetical protein [Achromobacter denitrificans]